jgi:exopolysaccharide biosynthesis polyprenyl glycosylphosphotransferase
VNATERLALLQSAEIYEEMHSVIDDRTLEILDRRRKTAVVRRRGWLVRRVLLVADVVGLALAFLLAQLAFGRSGGNFDARIEFFGFLATLPAWVVVAKLYGLYDQDEEHTNHSTADDVSGVFHVVTVGAWLFFAGAWVTHLADPDLTKLVTFWALAIGLVTIGRSTARVLARRSITYWQNAVIVGAGDVGQLVARKLLGHPEYGINLVGFVDATPKERRDDLRHLTLLGPPERLPAIVRLFDIERVIVAFSNDSHEQSLELVRSLKDLDVQVDIVPRLFEIVGPGVKLHTVEGLPLVGLPPLRLSRSSRLLKRVLDVTASAIALTFLAPVFALFAVLIKRDSPGPVFFRQVRMGARGETFKIWKFRTMSFDADLRKADVAHLNKHLRGGGDPRMFKIPDDPRVTTFGRWLRKHSFDELPQLLNVLLGQMSLVGPRPLILSEASYVDAWAQKRLDLKPGITGPWQVLGRSGIPFEDMLRLDYLYVIGWSFGGDLKLVAQTLPLLLNSPDPY